MYGTFLTRNEQRKLQAECNSNLLQTEKPLIFKSKKLYRRY